MRRELHQAQKLERELNPKVVLKDESAGWVPGQRKAAAGGGERERSRSPVRGTRAWDDGRGEQRRY